MTNVPRIHISIMLFAINLTKHKTDMHWVPDIPVKQADVDQAFPKAVPGISSRLDYQVYAWVTLFFDQELRLLFFFFILFLFGLLLFIVFTFFFYCVTFI